VIFEAILNRTPASPKDLRSDLPGLLDHIIAAALEKDRGIRCQTASEMRAELQQVRSDLDAGRASVATTSDARRMRRAKRRAVPAALVLFAITALSYIWFGRVKSIDSLAVLPFLSTTSNLDVEYLSEGITESLINALSYLPNLKVIARNSVFRYKGREVDPHAVGRELGVRAVLMGRLTQRSEKILISIELVDAKDSSHIWGEQYSQKLDDVLVAQRRLSTEISEQLRLTLTGAQREHLTKQYTASPEAYQLYLKGRYYFWNTYTEEGFRKGLGYFNSAIKADPAYALAYSGLAEAYYGLSSQYLAPREAMPKVKAAALKALALDETLAEAHAALGLANAQYDWDWISAEREYKRAIELNPGYAPVHFWYGSCLVYMARFEEAQAEFRRAQQFDPLAPAVNVFAVWPVLYGRHYEDAIAQLKKIAAADPTFYPARAHLGIAYEYTRRLPQALSELNEAWRLENIPWTAGWVGHANAIAGRRDEAGKILNHLVDRSKSKYVSPYSLALINAGLGNRDEAFMWLRKCIDERDEQVLLLKVEPALDPLRADPRFAELMRLTGLGPGH
jgi:TolB-like protein/Flp pilus assembly protein TadD